MPKRKTTDYTPDPTNANTGTERGLRALDDSLAKYGAGRSILVDKNGYVIAGNKTLERAVDLGIDDVIEVESDGHSIVAVKRTDLDLLTDPRARELAYADNRVAELDLTWNAEQLLDDLNAGVDLSQFWREDELQALLESILPAEAATDPGAQLDKAAELQQKWQVARGDVWTCGKHRLLCGDSTNAEDVARVMGGERADAVVTDPPYGINYRQGAGEGRNPKWRKRHIDVRIVMDDQPFDPTPFLELADLIILWGANNYANKLPNNGRWLVWDKKPDLGSNDLSDGELAWVNQKRTVRIFRHRWSGVIRSSQNGEMVLHPTEKPIELFKWCIEICEAGDLIIDPFGGSGTTMVACEQLGRQCRMIEISENYCSVILERMSGMGITPEREG